MCVQKMLRLLFDTIEDFDVTALDPVFVADLAAKGFNTTEVLYHGSQTNVAQFARRRSRMIFTSPDVQTASHYGPFVYACFGRQEPQANLMADAVDDKLLKTVVAALADNYIDHVENTAELYALRERIAARLFRADPYTTEWSDSSDYETEAQESVEYQAAAHKAAENFLIDRITAGSGEMSSTKWGSALQHDVLVECFQLRFTSVRFIDKTHKGAWENVAFDDSDNLVILGQVRGDDAV